MFKINLTSFENLCVKTISFHKIFFFSLLDSGWPSQWIMLQHGILSMACHQPQSTYLLGGMQKAFDIMECAHAIRQQPSTFQMQRVSWVLVWTAHSRKSINLSRLRDSNNNYLTLKCVQMSELGQKCDQNVLSDVCFKFVGARAKSSVNKIIFSQLSSVDASGPDGLVVVY